MTSERQKREEEIERLLRGEDSSPNSDVAFQEEVRQTAAAMVQEEVSRIQRSEGAERRKRSIRPLSVGLWLLVSGAAAFAFSMPGLAAALIVCGMAAIVWDILRQPPLSRHSIRSIISGFLKRHRV